MTTAPKLRIARTDPATETLADRLYCYEITWQSRPGEHERVCAWGDTEARARQQAWKTALEHGWTRRRWWQLWRARDRARNGPTERVREVCRQIAAKIRRVGWHPDAEGERGDRVALWIELLGHGAAGHAARHCFLDHVGDGEIYGWEHERGRAQEQVLAVLDELAQ